MSEIDNKILMGIFGLIAGCYAWLIKILLNGKGAVTTEEFTRHKESVQYKDNCTEIVKRIDEKLDLILKEISK